MNDVTLVVVGLIIGLGLLFGAAYFLEKRTKTARDYQNIQTKQSRASRVWQWVLRGLLVVLALLVLCTFLFHSLTFIWIALGLVVLLSILGPVYRVYRLIEFITK